jgi:hypothetical protein
MVETGRSRPPAASRAGTGATSASTGTDADNVEFARMLLDIATRKAAERGSELPIAAAAGGAAKTAKAAEAAKTANAVETAEAVGSAGTTKTTEPVNATSATKTTQSANATSATNAVNATKVTNAVNAVRATAAFAEQVTTAELPAPADVRLTLRRRLAELGVPFERIPADPSHHYAAIEQLVHQLPQVGPLPQSGDAIVVLAGPSGALAQATRVLVERMDLPSERLWTFGCSALSAADRRLVEAADARALARAVRRGKGATATPPTLVVVCTDHAEDATADARPSAATIIAALSPDACWLHVDATRKPADTARQLAELGTPTALVVTGAARTASPASVWELDVPVALLDGRPASASAWAVLMLEKLAEAAA